MLEVEIVAALRARGLTVSAAESCTGGLIAKKITDVPGSSAVIEGSLVSYSNRIKCLLAGVSPETIAAHTEVSQETALEMARGVRKLFSSAIGLATTGYAGPGGGTDEHPLGTVFVAVSSEDFEKVEELHIEQASREAVREAAANRALTLALSALKQYDLNQKIERILP